MSVEERILNFIEEGCDKPSWEGKELRAIALEVRKREDRIKQLEEEIMEVKNKYAVLVADVVLNEDRAERIKQLEEENDAMRADLLLWKDWVEEERDKP